MHRAFMTLAYDFFSQLGVKYSILNYLSSTQMPKRYIVQIDQIHKSHNAPVPYSTFQNSNMHMYILNGALWVWDKCIVGFVRLFYCLSSI